MVICVFDTRTTVTCVHHVIYFTNYCTHPRRPPNAKPRVRTRASSAARGRFRKATRRVLRPLPDPVTRYTGVDTVNRAR